MDLVQLDYLDFRMLSAYQRSQHFATLEPDIKVNCEPKERKGISLEKKKVMEETANGD